jgi:hypothetical protein
MSTRASPVELRKALDMAKTLSDAGILFVPMPVSNETESAKLVAEAMDKLEQMAVVAEEVKP